MSTFKQDNIIRHKLQELDELPQGVDFDAVVTWQKIETKLQPKQKSKSFLWLSVAAIVLLAVLSTIIADQKKTLPAIATKVPAPSSNILHNNSNSSVTIPVIQQQSFAGKKRKIPELVITVENKNNDTISNEQPPLVVAQNNTTANVLEMITTTNAAAPVVKKARLKVIHLDELYKPIPEEIVKAEIKKKADEVVAETETPVVTPSRSFWKSRSPQKIAVTLTDNQ